MPRGAWTPTCSRCSTRSTRSSASAGTDRAALIGDLLRRHHRLDRRRTPGEHRPAGPAGRVRSRGDGPRQRPGRHRRRAGRPPAGRGGDRAVAPARLPRRAGAGRGVRLAAPRRPGLELLGQQLPARASKPPAFDILFWNADTTRMPAQLHADFVDLAMDNPLVTPGRDDRARAYPSTCPGSRSTPTSWPGSPTT